MLVRKSLGMRLSSPFSSNKPKRRLYSLRVLSTHCRCQRPARGEKSDVLAADSRFVVACSGSADRSRTQLDRVNIVIIRVLEA